MQFSKVLVVGVLGTLLFAAAGAPLAWPRPAQAAPATAPLVVNDSGDFTPCSGSLTLRCAIIAANSVPFTYIRFAPGLQAVLLTSPLPVITGNGTWIDGHDVSNGCVCPRLDGAFWTGAGGNVLSINADDVTISNLNMVRMPVGGADISILGGHDVTIAYNSLGVLPGATGCATADTNYGVALTPNTGGTSAAGHGVAYIYANTISCHHSYGILILGANYVSIGLDRSGNVGGNLIGLTPDGLHAAGNGEGGIYVTGSGAGHLTVRGNLIADNGEVGLFIAAGGDDEETYNTLAGNAGPGLWIAGGGPHTIIGNNLGVGPDGLTAWPNTQAGVLVSGGTGLFLSANVVAYNGGAGIAVTGDTTQALIQDNELHDNGGLPIDLGDDGPTRNGAQFPPGPNAWLGYPVVTAASGSLVQGFTCPNCAVYVYRAFGDPARPHGGGHLLTNTFANGFGQWSVSLPPGVTAADISLTAFNPAGDSSEMSPRPQVFLPLVWR